MICLDRPVGDGSRGSIVVIFVMGGADNTAYGARDLLEAYMKRWE